MPRLAASVTMMFTEHPLLDRFAAAARQGFRAVEVQAPYEEPAEALAGAMTEHGVTPVLLNLPAAVAAVPGEETAFREALTTALAYARATGCRQLHCLAGATESPAAHDTFVSNLRWAADEARPLGVDLLLEPLNTVDNPGYFLRTTRQAREILDAVGADNVGLQLDFYHVQIMEGGLSARLREHLPVVRHVQISGVPGRHEPDATQEINYEYLLGLVDEVGFTGWVGCEYRPRAGTVDGLGWAGRYGIGPSASD